MFKPSSVRLTCTKTNIFQIDQKMGTKANELGFKGWRDLRRAVFLAHFRSISAGWRRGKVKLTHVIARDRCGALAVDSEAFKSRFRIWSGGQPILGALTSTLFCERRLFFIILNSPLAVNASCDQVYVREVWNLVTLLEEVRSNCGFHDLKWPVFWQHPSFDSQRVNSPPPNLNTANKTRQPEIKRCKHVYVAVWLWRRRQLAWLEGSTLSTPHERAYHETNFGSIWASSDDQK